MNEYRAFCGLHEPEEPSSCSLLALAGVTAVVVVVPWFVGVWVVGRWVVRGVRTMMGVAG